MKKYLVLILLAVIVSSCQDEILNDSNPVIESNYSAPPMGMSNRLTVVLQQELH